MARYFLDFDLFRLITINGRPTDKALSPNITTPIAFYEDEARTILADVYANSTGPVLLANPTHADNEGSLQGWLEPAVYYWSAGEKQGAIYAIVDGYFLPLEIDPSFRTRVPGDTQDRLRVRNTGVLEWGSGSAAVDVNLFRADASTLRTNDMLDSMRTLATEFGFAVVVSGDSIHRFAVRADGQLEWGSGSAVRDMVLTRPSAGLLEVVGGTFRVAAPAPGTNEALSVYTVGDTASRWYTRGDGALFWGPGNAVQDTFLFRSSARALQSNASFVNSVAAAGTVGFQTSVDGDGFARYIVFANGSMIWGPGNAALDSTLQRVATSLLEATNTAIRSNRVLGTDAAFATLLNVDSFHRLLVQANGVMQWGPGNAAADTTLYRDGVGILRTDSFFQAGALQAFAGVRANWGGSVAAYGIAARNPGFSVFGPGGAGNSFYGLYLGHDNANYGLGLIGDEGHHFTLFGGRLHTGNDNMNSPRYTLKINNLAAKLEFSADGGAGVAPVWDTNLYRRAANILTTDDAFESQRSAAGDDALGTWVTGDSVHRFMIDADGAHEWGPGTGARDTVLQRIAPAYLRLFGSFNAQVAAATDALSANVSGDTVVRWRVRGDGQHEWSSGSAAADVILYRPEANVLQTNDQFRVVRAVGSDVAHFVQVSGDTFARFGVFADGSMVWGSGSAGIDAAIGRIVVGVLTFDARIARNMSTAQQTVVNGSTITLNTSIGAQRLTAAGAITGLIMPAGSTDGEEAVLINQSAFTLTFAVAGTSRVADGATFVIPALRRVVLAWSADTSLWYGTT